MALKSPKEVRSPDWWLLYLGRQLRDRHKTLDRWWAYYSGNHPLPQGPQRRNEAYRDFQKKARTNFCETIVNASVDRLRLLGITDVNGEQDDPAWRWWKQNRLDARQKQVYRTALALAHGYVMVGQHPRDKQRPLVTIEHPREVIMAEDPATGERQAAVKAWYDPIERIGRANVYMPDEVIRYGAEARGRGPLPWGEQSWTEIDRKPHGMQQVPVVEFANRPFPGEDPTSDFHAVIDNQDRINFGVLNRMTAERYSAFRQKWVKGHKFKKVRDPETGLEVPEQPFIPDPGAVWASEQDTAMFGDFQATDLMGYLKAHDTDIRTLLTISRTPAYYYAGDLINIGTDTIQALDTLHISKVEEQQGTFGEDWEDVFTLCGQVEGIEADYSLAELRWKNARYLNPAVAADAAVKKKGIGYPLAVLAEDMDESPQRIRRILSEVAGEQMAGATALLLAQQAQTAAQTTLPADDGGVADGGA